MLYLWTPPRKQKTLLYQTDLIALSDKAKFSASLWASIDKIFKDFPFPLIVLNWKVVTGGWPYDFACLLGLNCCQLCYICQFCFSLCFWGLLVLIDFYRWTVVSLIKKKKKQKIVSVCILISSACWRYDFYSTIPELPWRELSTNLLFFHSAIWEIWNHALNMLYSAISGFFFKSPLWYLLQYMQT